MKFDISEKNVRMAHGRECVDHAYPFDCTREGYILICGDLLAGIPGEPELNIGRKHMGRDIDGIAVANACHFPGPPHSRAFEPFRKGFQLSVGGATLDHPIDFFKGN